jgi:hypothetical protein
MILGYDYNALGVVGRATLASHSRVIRVIALIYNDSPVASVTFRLRVIYRSRCEACLCRLR